MKFLVSASLLASLVTAASVDLTKRDSPLDLSLELVGNTGVRAVIKNSGPEALRLLKTGSILDDKEVEKSEVFAGSEKVEFDGVRVWLDYTLLEADSFRTIEAGEEIEVTWDVAVDHDLSAGGDFDITSSGVVSYAALDSNDIVGAAAFSSNVLHAHVDGEAASKVRREFHEEIEKRAAVQSDCTGTRRTAVVNALSNCRAAAAAAASAASSGPAARMTEFFKSSTTATRNTVAGVYNRIATECGTSTGGVSRLYCSDVYNACSAGVVAYAVPSLSIMVNCAPWFNNYAGTTTACRGISQAGVTLHEVSHLSQVRGTQDYNCYGYNCLRGLSASQNINHADTYMYFAQAVRSNC